HDVLALSPHGRGRAGGDALAVRPTEPWPFVSGRGGEREQQEYGGHVFGPAGKGRGNSVTRMSLARNRMTAAVAYLELIRHARDLTLLQSCGAVLGWDQQTYMPTAGAGLRGDQLALLARLTHERATSPRLGELLAVCEAGG